MRTSFRRGVLAAASGALAIVAPSFIPSVGAAYPAPQPSHSDFPWQAIAVLGSPTALIFNGIYIWRTQCREMTREEVVASGLLPIVGALLNEKNNKCRK